MKQGLAIVALAFTCTALTSPATADITEGRTDQDRRYMVGGVGVEEVEQMRQQSAQFPLQLIVASRSGAYLADTRVRISSPQHGTVLDTTLNAPWLLVDLQPGSYSIEATHRGRSQQRQVNLAAGGRQQLVLQFDVPVDQPATSGETRTDLPADLRPGTVPR